jgi:hypothetical protein
VGESRHRRTTGRVCTAPEGRGTVDDHFRHRDSHPARRNWIALYSGRYSQQNGTTNALLDFAVIILARVAYRGYRLYNTWRNLKAAQQAHRSLG